MRAQKFHSILSGSFWRAYWLTMRPYLIFVSGAAGLVGLSFIRSADPIRTLFAFIPLFLSYGLGQALTDCFQMDTDAISSPYRPLVRGIISKSQVLAVSLAGLAASVLILIYLNPYILFPGVAAVAGLLTYTPFKKRWWGGPFWNSWIVALLPVIGRMTDRDFHITEVLKQGDTASIAFLLAVAAVFFGYGNFVVMGYLKDISADRQTSYRTFPVVFGWKATAVYSDILALACASFTGLTLLTLKEPQLPAWGVLAAAVAVNLYAQVKIHRTRSESAAHGPIGHVVRAFILYSLAVVLALKGEWLVPAAVFYGFFEAALRYRPEKSQV